MATIDKLDFSVYIQYAKRTEMIEEVNKQYRFHEAFTIPAQIQVMDISPRGLEVDILLGAARCYAPWAFFWPPKKFFAQRRPSFSSYRVVPSLGTLEKQAADYAKICNYPCSSSRQEAEKGAIISCLEVVDKLNEWVGHVIGRIAQFLQG